MKPKHLAALKTTALPGIILASLFLVAEVNAQEPQRTKIDTNREVIQTYAQVYMEQRDFARTESLLTDYLLQDEKASELWEILGDAQLQQRHYSQACYSLRKANEYARERTDKQRTLYRFADCLNRGGKRDEAYGVLKQLSKVEQGSESGSQALSMMEEGTLKQGAAFPPYSLAPRGHWRLSGAIGSGFDTNVLLVQEDVANNTPVNNRGSFYVTPAVQLGYTGSLWGKPVDTRYIAAFTDYFAENAKSFNSLYQRAEGYWGAGERRWGAFVDTFFMNRNPFQIYNWDAGLSWLQQRKLDSTHFLDIEIPVRYQNYPIDSTSLSDNVRSGVDVQGQLRYRAMRSDREMFSLSGVLEEQWTSGKNFRETELSIPAVYTAWIPFFKKWDVLNSFNAGFDAQYYFQSDSHRRDHAFHGGLGLIKRVAGDWNVDLEYLYMKNLSNVDSAKYTKEVISLMVSHEFI